MLDETTRDRIQTEVDGNDVLLFMKGTPVFPQCGFSAAVIQVLSHLQVKFSSVNVLEDPDIRDGIKQYSKKLDNSKIWDYEVPVGLSIGGNDVVEYVNNIDFLESTFLSKKINYFYELNISCPNIRNGRSLGENPLELENMLRKVQEISKKHGEAQSLSDAASLLENSKLSYLGPPTAPNNTASTSCALSRVALDKGVP